MLALGLLFAFFGDLATARQVYWGGDLTHLMYPLVDLTARCLRGLDFDPLVWNTQLMAGHPLLAEGQAGVFYPPNWLLFLALPAREAMSASLVFSHLFTLATMFWLGRVLGLGHAAALVGALALAFGGFGAAHVTHLNVVAAVPWVPLVIGLLEKACRVPDRRFALLAGAAWGVQWTTGHPQVPAMTGLFAVVYVAWRLFPDGRGGRTWARAAGATLAVFTAAGLGLAAAHLLPLFQLARLSLRGGAALSYEAASAYSLAWPSLWTAMLPFLYGVSNTYAGPANFAEATFYAGAPTLLLALATLPAARRSPVLRFWWAVAAASLLLALGAATPAYRLVHALPGFSGLRAPARFVLLLDLALALLAGLGMDALSRAGAATRASRGLVAAVALGAPLAAIAWAAGLLPAPLPPRSARYAWMAAAAFLLSGLWAMAIGRFPAARWRLIGAALLAADLWFFFTTVHAPYRVGTQRARVDAPGLEFVARQPGLHRVFPMPDGRVEPVQSNVALLFGVDVVDGYASLPLERQHRLVYGLARSEPTAPAVLGVLGVGYLAATAETRPFRPRDSHRGVFFQKGVHLALLGPGAVREAAYALGDRPVSELRLVYGLEGTPAVSSGAPAARIVLESRGAERREFAIRTGEGHAVIDGSGSRTFAVRSAPGCEGEGACSFVAIPVEGGFVARRLVLRHEGEGGRFRLRGLTLLPPVNGEKVLSPLMQEGLDTVHEAGDTIVLRNPDELPRAYAAHRVHRAADGDAAREALLAGAARHGEAVVLEDPRAPEPTGAGPSTVRVERYAPRSVEIQAEMAGDGYLVLSDAHYPGWRARVDGRPVPIYIANSLFRAVYLDGGKHRVTFDFRPVALHAGLAITAITLLVSAAALIRRPRARA